MFTVKFWRQLDGSFVAQKGNEFWRIPKCASEAVENDKSLRNSIAENFDAAPLKTDAFNIFGATVIDEITI